ncbi:site-specific integrase [Aliterella atlantica]|uniref:Integrase n=1 Tax=Aliterella atlantica CENA595 TaxID=1618023 RepID=A0A0D8ZPW4_9CYAN|nr:integrase [Aliterella atlantica]KJH70387.1 integrase [Aliterella atlantica CENA595]
MPPKDSSYDPRKAEWNGCAIAQFDPANYKQWKPKDKSDRAIREREYLRIKYAVNQVNKQLDLAKVKVKLKLTNHQSIGLQGTFPCKPGDVGKNGSPNKQYLISLGIAANDAGIKTAEFRARELDLLLMTKQFQWQNELLGKQAQKLALPDEKLTLPIYKLIELYKQQFWRTHAENRQGLRTWDSHYLRHLKKLPQNEPISENALIQAFDKTLPNTSARFYLAWQLRKFCEFCGFDGSGAIASYTTRKPKPSFRQIPADAEITAGFAKIGRPLSPFASKENLVQPQQWQWLYGMLATYGLRPHELFAVDLDAWTAPANTLHLVTLNPSLTQGTKTGERSCGIPPLHPQWVDLFNLKQPKIPTSSGTLANQTARIHIKFRTANIGFPPYSLRHAYAIRGHLLRIPIKTMADYMGHSVQEHTKTYQRWMDKDVNLEIYQQVVMKKQETEAAALKAEVELLRGMLGRP